MVAPALAGRPQRPPLQLDFFTLSERRDTCATRELAPETQSFALRQPGVPSMFDSLEVKVLYPT